MNMTRYFSQCVPLNQHVTKEKAKVLGPPVPKFQSPV